jgi:hypothetical protein
MKHVKAYKTFEATKSKLLGKTLRNVTKSTRSEIIKFIKSICNEIGMPISELSDKYFKYERKSRRILSLGANEHKMCDVCNGDGYISTSSLVKKSVVTQSKQCDKCKGVGVEYNQDKNLYKFWLNEEGEFQSITLTDGKYYGNTKSENFWQTQKIDFPVDAYQLETPELQSKFLEDNGIIPGKTRLTMSYGKSWNPQQEIGVFWKDNNGYYHFINNGIGETKSRGTGVNIPGTKWKELGTHHISLEMIDNHENSYKIRLCKILSNVPTEDPYGYNMKVRIGYRDNISKDYKGIDESYIKDADYVILFDFDKYKTDVEAGEFKPTEDTKKERQASKKDAAALLSNEQIKKTNLERYRQKISDINLKDGIGKLINKTPHLLGGKNFLFFSMKDSFRYSFSRLLDELYRYIDSVNNGNVTEQTYYEKEVVDKVRRMISDNQSKNADMSQFITKIKKELAEKDERLLVEFNKVNNEFERISREYKIKYFSKKFETVEQLETIIYTIKTLDSLNGNNRIVPNYLYHASSYLSSTGRIVNELVEEWEKNGDLSDTMKKMKKLEDTLNFM